MRRLGAALLITTIIVVSITIVVLFEIFLFSTLGGYAWLVNIVIFLFGFVYDMLGDFCDDDK